MGSSRPLDEELAALLAAATADDWRPERVARAVERLLRIRREPGSVSRTKQRVTIHLPGRGRDVHHDARRSDERPPPAARHRQRG